MMRKISIRLIGWMVLMQPALLVAQPVGNIRGVVTYGASGQALPLPSYLFNYRYSSMALMGDWFLKYQL